MPKMVSIFNIIITVTFLYFRIKLMWIEQDIGHRLEPVESKIFCTRTRIFNYTLNISKNFFLMFTSSSLSANTNLFYSVYPYRWVPYLTYISQFSDPNPIKSKFWAHTRRALLIGFSSNVLLIQHSLSVIIHIYRYNILTIYLISKMYTNDL